MSQRIEFRAGVCKNDCFLAWFGFAGPKEETAAERFGLLAGVD